MLVILPGEEADGLCHSALVELITCPFGKSVCAITSLLCLCFAVQSQRHYLLPAKLSIDLLLFTGAPVSSCLSKRYQKRLYHRLTCKSSIIKSPPTMWWWRLIVFAESARRRHLFICNFFFVFQFLNKIQDGCQNLMSPSRA